MEHEKQSSSEKFRYNPFYSLLNKEQKSFLFGISKGNVIIIAVIILILILGMTATYFVNQGRKEKRVENIGIWYEDVGTMICEDKKDCVQFFDTTVKDRFIENNFIPPEKIDLDELKTQLKKELRVFDSLDFTSQLDERTLNKWVDKCAQHPDIQTGIAIRQCALNMMFLDSQF